MFVDLTRKSKRICQSLPVTACPKSVSMQFVLMSKAKFCRSSSDCASKSRLTKDDTHDLEKIVPVLPPIENIPPFSANIQATPRKGESPTRDKSTWELHWGTHTGSIPDSTCGSTQTSGANFFPFLLHPWQRQNDLYFLRQFILEYFLTSRFSRRLASTPWENLVCCWARVRTCPCPRPRVLPRYVAEKHLWSSCRINQWQLESFPAKKTSWSYADCGIERVLFFILRPVVVEFETISQFL